MESTLPFSCVCFVFLLPDGFVGKRVTTESPGPSLTNRTEALSLTQNIAPKLQYTTAHNAEHCTHFRCCNTVIQTFV